MKKLLIFFIPLVLCLSCDWINQDDPVFDYNLKSAKVINTNNNFGLELFNEILKNDQTGNIMISPTSVSLALGMTYNGAESTTKEAFDDVLNYGDLTREEVNEISRDLINTLVTNKKGNLLEIANSIWYRDEFPVYESFINTNKTYYDAEIRELDFSDPDAVKTINKWVSDKTNKKIDKIIQDLSPETMMLLINALYFNCVWEYEFDPDNTKNEMFFNEDLSQYREVKMMTIESTFNYAVTDNYTAVEMPYKDGKFSMHLFLPSSETSVDELVEELDGNRWNEWMEAYEEHEEVQVILPKFKFEYKRSIGPDLIDMGLGEAFSSSADFSGISEIALLISAVIHKTYIDVSEEGTEAAAVTAVVMDLASAGPEMPVIIRFDKPFLFAITENSSNSIIFIGKLMKP